MAQVTNVKTVDTKEQKGVLVEYLVEKYGQSGDFFIPDGAILDGQIDSRRVRSGMPVEYMSKDGRDFDWGQYSEDVEIQKKIANAFVYSFATFRKQGRGLYIYSSTKGSGKTLLACCLANEVLKKQDVSIKFTKAIRRMLKLLGQAEKEEERKPHNKDQIYKTLDSKFAVEFEKLFGKGACKKVFGVQKPSYTLYLEFFDKLNDLFEEWIKKI